jgi:hypothetical protein
MRHPNRNWWFQWLWQDGPMVRVLPAPVATNPDPFDVLSAPALLKLRHQECARPAGARS